MARSTRVLSISVPEKLAQELDRMAEEEGVSRSELVRLIARAYKRERSEEGFLRLQRGLFGKARALSVGTEEVERLVFEDRQALRLVFDTNVYVSAFVIPGRAGRILLCVSTPAAVNDALRLSNAAGYEARVGNVLEECPRRTAGP